MIIPSSVALPLLSLRRAPLAALAICGALFGKSPQAQACDVALMLAVDVSGSVDPSEYGLQMQGLADALRDPEISTALVELNALVALTQWSGSSRQQFSLAWRSMTSKQDVDAFAADVAQAPRAWRNFSTAIGQAIQFSAHRLSEAPKRCARRIIDVSGDGASNEGAPPEIVAPKIAEQGVVVNGLAIESAEPDVTGYYQQNVIAGPGAFVITANSFEDYARAIRLKLQRELLTPVAQLDQPRPDPRAGE